MQYFIPADAAPRLTILPNAVPIVPPAVARAAIAQHTQPGDVVLDPFCAGLGVIQAALDLDRRLIAASFNPINTLAIAATLWPRDAHAAFTHLADARKGTSRLQDHVLGLYTTACPTCRRPALAQHFLWDREQNAPIEKHVRCPACGESIGPTDQTDRVAAQRFNPRGLPFWSLHGRVINAQHEDADRVSEVIDAYTPRAQDALNDIVLKFQALAADDQRALRPALLATLDACTTLHGPDEARYPSGLKPPPYFIEKNVWFELEHSVSLRPPGVPAPARVSTIQDLLEVSAPAVCLLTAPARELVKPLPPQSIQLLITHPPLPRPGFWALSTVWAAWLWGADRIDHLLPLLSRKRTNWDWQWRALASALSAVHPALRAEARSVMTCAADETILESVTLAGASAQYDLDSVVCDPLDGARLTWQIGRSTTQHLTPPNGFLRAMQSDVSRAATAILRARAEPTPWPTLLAGILANLGHSTALPDFAQLPESDQTPLAQLRELVKASLAAAPVQEVGSRRWWLSGDEGAGTPLADRVEEIVFELLRERNEWSAFDLVQEVYRHLPGVLTPDRALVATTIHSYAEELPSDRVRLRPEDNGAARTAEVIEVEALLLEIGSRLGFEAERSGNEALRRIVWHAAESFTISPSASVKILLRQAPGVLVIPGGRATLLQHKLARDARLAETRWRLLKFSAVRNIAQHAALSSEIFQLALGLQPPIDQPATQLEMNF